MTQRRRVPRTQTVLWFVRHQRVLTQRQMARTLGLTQQHYSKYETGRLVPPRSVQDRIAAVLGVRRRLLWPAEKAARQPSSEKARRTREARAS